MLTAALTACCAVIVTAVLALKPKAAKYVPGEKESELTESLARNLPPDFPGCKFSDVTQKAGIQFTHFTGTRTSQLPEDMGSGAAWGDYDQDGYPDLFLVNQDGPVGRPPGAQNPGARCALYHNNRDGTFTDISDAAGLGQVRGCFMGAAWGDYNNDGYPDLFITAYGRCRLFHNEPAPTGKSGPSRVFRDVTAKAGVGSIEGFWTGVSWGDYDRDGRLDIYVCGYVKYHSPTAEERSAKNKQGESDVPFTLNPSSYSPERNLLFHNNSDGTFTETAKSAGVDDPSGRSLSACWCDFDGDGWPDLYVNNDVSMHAFYRNLGNGHFQDVSTSSWACDYRGGMGIAVGDWDNNGDMDMFLTHWIAQENALYHNMRSVDKAKSKALHFADISDQVGLGQSTIDFIGWGTAFLDFDNDGRLDLAMANGSTFEEPSDHAKLIAMRNQLFWNGNRKSRYLEHGSSDRGFFEVEQVAGDALKRPNVGRGLATADYDRDGSMDMVITRNGGPALLLKNETATKNGWVELWLKGVKSNRDAIGATVRIKSGGERQMRVVGAQSSYLSQEDLVVHFGLGSAVEIDEMEVFWPSGLMQRFSHVAGNRFLTLSEGGTLKPIAKEPSR